MVVLGQYVRASPSQQVFLNFSACLTFTNVLLAEANHIVKPSQYGRVPQKHVGKWGQYCNYLSLEVFIRFVLCNY